MKKNRGTNDSTGERLAITEPSRNQGPRLKTREDELIARLEEERSQRTALAQRYSGLEAQYTRLARFYVAAHRLLTAESQEDIYAAIQDIVANLIGCEELGIFRFDDQTRDLCLASSIGLDGTDLGCIPVESSLIGTTMMHGEAYFGGKTECCLAQEANITACIPLRSNDRILGAVATFRLLPQKSELTAEDRDLLCLLGKLSAAALLSASACNSGTPIEGPR